MKEQDQETGLAESETLWLKALGTVIVAERFRLQMTQQQFALKSGLNRTYLSDVEAGRRKVKVITLNLIARSFGVTSSTLIDQVDEQHLLLMSKLAADQQLASVAQSSLATHVSTENENAEAD